jgi:ABC-2 type transport system permease protein
MPVNWISFIPVFLLAALASTTISVLIGVISPNTRMTVMFSQVIFLPSMLIGGVMFPISLLPETIGKVAQLLPTTHIMNVMSEIVMGGKAAFSVNGSIITLLSASVFAFVLSLLLFSWDSKNTTRKLHPAFAILVLLPNIIFILTQ